MAEPPSIGATIRLARQGRGLGLRELARQAGWSPSFLCDVEHGRRVPTSEKMAAMAQVLGLDPDLGRCRYCGAAPCHQRKDRI